MCVDLNSPTVGRGQVDSYLSPLNDTSSPRTTLPGSRAERDAVGTVTEGQLKQICLIYRNVNCIINLIQLIYIPTGLLHSELQVGLNE